MSGRESVTEESGVHKEWLKRAQEIKSIDELMAFMREMQEKYDHDYGTICHAMVACAIGALRAMDRGPNGGITGFQAGCIQWGIIREWGAMLTDPDEPMWMMKGGDLLYPQYSKKIMQVPESAMQWAKSEAAKRLKWDTNSAHPDVIAHWRGLANGSISWPTRD